MHRCQPSALIGPPHKAFRHREESEASGSFKDNLSVLLLTVGEFSPGIDLRPSGWIRLCNVNFFTCRKRKQRFMPSHRNTCCSFKAYSTFLFICCWFMNDEGLWFNTVCLSRQLLSVCLPESCGNLDRTVNAKTVYECARQWGWVGERGSEHCRKSTTTKKKKKITHCWVRSVNKKIKQCLHRNTFIHIFPCCFSNAVCDWTCSVAPPSLNMSATLI